MQSVSLQTTIGSQITIAFFRIGHCEQKTAFRSVDEKLYVENCLTVCRGKSFSWLFDIDQTDFRD